MISKRAFSVLVFVIITLTTFAQDTIHLKTYFRDLKCVDVYVGGEKYNFLFDTGGGETFISHGIATRIKKEIYGSCTGIRMDGERLKYQKADSVSMLIGPAEVFHNTLGVWDVMSILPPELPRVDGIISLKSFSGKILTIDLANNEVIIENKKSSKSAIKGKTLLESRFVNGSNGEELNVFIGLNKNHRTYWFLFDTGNIGPMAFSPECFSAWELKPDTGDTGNTGGSIEFKIGKNVIKADAYSKDIIYDGALNYESLNNNVYTIDLVKEKVWIN